MKVHFIPEVDSHCLNIVHFLSSGCEHSTPWMRYAVKKVRGFPVPRRDVTYQLPLAGNNLIITGQGEFGKSNPG